MKVAIKKIIPEKWLDALRHQGFKRYFANTGWMFGGQIISLLASFFIGTWLARYLGPEYYGLLNYSMAFVGLFGFIAALGVDGILNRELVKFPEQRDKLLGTAFRLKIIGGLTASLITIGAAFCLVADPLARLLIILFSLSLILQALNVISSYFQAEVKTKNNFKAVFGATIISSILKIAIILFSQGVLWVIIVYTLDFLWQGLGFIIAYYQHGLKIKAWRFDKKLSWEIIKSSYPLMFAAAAGFAYSRVDQIIISFLLNNQELGIYVAAVKLVEVWYFFPVLICASLFPAIINAKKTDALAYKRRLKNLYILMTLLAVVIAIPVAGLAKFLVYTLFGPSYAASVEITRIYVWSNLGLFLGCAINYYLMSENLIKIIFWLNIATLAANVALNFLLIPALGLSGAAWATLISYLIVPILALAIEKYRKYKKPQI